MGLRSFANPPIQAGVLEGKARLSLLVEDQRKVFYNPKMSLSRDLAVLFAASHFPSSRQLRLCDPMTGSGVRTVRYLLETGNVANAIAGDKSLAAVNAARRTISQNGLEKRAEVTESDANLLLLHHSNDRFDLVDLDPFGSPGPYLESALRATTNGGIIAATATDMAPLTGARPLACFRKYGATPARTEFEKEVALRILAGCVAGVAARLDLGIEIAFAHASDHYVRLYSSLSKGTPSANRSTKMIGYLRYCSKCLTRSSVNSLTSIPTVCGFCGSQASLVGPMWLGPLWVDETVRIMIQRTPNLESSRLGHIQTLLSRILEETSSPIFHYRTDAFARTLRIKPPGITRVLQAFHEAGYTASRTHFDPNGFRTDAPMEKITVLLRGLA